MDCSDWFFLAIATKKEFHFGDRAYQKTLQTFYLVSNFSNFGKNERTVSHPIQITQFINYWHKDFMALC